MDLDSGKNGYYFCSLIYKPIRIKTTRGTYENSPKNNLIFEEITIKGYIIDPRDPIETEKYSDVVPDFGNQYNIFHEDIDDKFVNQRRRNSLGPYS